MQHVMRYSFPIAVETSAKGMKVYRKYDAFEWTQERDELMAFFHVPLIPDDPSRDLLTN